MLIFDSSTLILITKAELLDPFLGSIGLEVGIPKEVERECSSAKKSLDALMIQKAVHESRIKVIGLRHKKLAAKLQGDFSLGSGEAEAIALAVAEKAQLLGIDDKNGINACKLLNLAFTTAMGILIRLREKGLLGDGDAAAKLEILTRFGRYKKSIIEDAKRKLGALR